MEKELLESLVEQNLTQRKMAQRLNVCFSTVRYWLKKYGMETKRISKYEMPMRVCFKCGKEKKKEEFYSRRGKEYSSSYCKPCTNEQTIERQQALKLLAVEYKGGKCERCGYHKCGRALEFHHFDPKEKDFNFSDVKSKVFSELIKKELDKCMLVCSNCHREIHDDLDRKKM